MGDVLFLSKISAHDCRRVSQVRTVPFSFHHIFLINLISERRWTAQRKAFGKPLNSQAVIRSKMAEMIQRIESVQSWLENITHQMNHMVRTYASTYATVD
jgi:hypothetical protein